MIACPWSKVVANAATADWATADWAAADWAASENAAVSVDHNCGSGPVGGGGHDQSCAEPLALIVTLRKMLARDFRVRASGRSDPFRRIC